MAATTDKSLLSAELEGDEEPEALRRILLQVTQGADEAEAPPGSSSTAVTPQPGFCVKTHDGDAKVFVNVCHSPAVPAPPPLAPPDLRLLLGSDAASSFRIPMSLGEPHAELDRSGQGCTAYDVVVNSALLRTLQADPLYLEFFLTIVMEGLAEKYGVAVNHPGWRVLQNRKFLGSVSAQNIRTRPRPRIQELEGEEPPPPQPSSPPPPPPPAYVVVAEPSARSPRVLQARVHLPHVSGAGQLELALSEERLVLGGTGGGTGGGGPPLLELGLPLPPDPARCHACFHRGTKVLTVTMPLQL